MTQEFDSNRLHEHTFVEISKYIEELKAELHDWKEIAYRNLHTMPLSVEHARRLAVFLKEKSGK